jgi:CheY-like chemotaxis protein
VGTLASGVAHDFNNLLMGIQGRVSLMMMKTDPAHPHFEHLQIIEELIKSASDLTKQLLGFARGGKYEVQATDLNTLISNQSNLFGRTRKEITISEYFESPLWLVDVDHGQIEQVMLNLFVNSWHAMPEGGSIYIHTENTIMEENYTNQYKVKPGRYVKVSVTDTGEGMDKETQERIFEPFFTTKAMGRGTGLGLASVYGIIKNHNGFINVYSEKGKGTTFNIYLPASGVEVAASIETKPDKIVKGSETILLIDDEEYIIDIGKKILEELGYKVLITTDGKEAVDIYKKDMENIDIVILDMIMPGIGGGMIYSSLKEHNNDVKVLLSSGYPINGQVGKIMTSGCNGFIQKPFDIMKLSHKIREILDNQGNA